MGFQHFKSMYAEALDVDRRALPLAARLKWDRDGIPRDEHPYAANMHFGRAMQIARGLLAVGDEFIAELKELHAARKIELLGIDIQTGRRTPVTCPSYLDDDIADLDPLSFHRAMVETSLDV